MNLILGELPMGAGSGAGGFPSLTWGTGVDGSTKTGWAGEPSWSGAGRAVYSEKGGKKHWEYWCEVSDYREYWCEVSDHWEYWCEVSDNWEYWCEVSDVLAVERVWDVWQRAAEGGCLQTHFLTILLPPDVRDIPKTWLAFN